MVVYSHARQKASFRGWSHSAFCLPGPVPWHGLIDFLLDKVLPNQVICTGQKLPRGVPLSWLQIQTSCIWLSRGIAAKHLDVLPFARDLRRASLRSSLSVSSRCSCSLLLWLPEKSHFEFYEPTTECQGLWLWIILLCLAKIILIEIITRIWPRAWLTR